MENKKVSEMTIAELNQALLDEGFLDKTLSRFCKNVMGIDPQNQEEINAFREDISFIRAVREYLKKILISCITGLLYISGLAILYAVIEHKLFR